MNLQEYVIKHGTKHLFALATICDRSEGYFSNLLYTINAGHNPPKTPSIKLAKKMCHASFGELTMEGLASPVRIDKSLVRPRMKKGFNPKVDG
jgi:hypothetical protein